MNGWVPLVQIMDEVNRDNMNRWFEGWRTTQSTRRIIQVSTRKYRARKGR